MKRITLFSGHYGSGKTNLAVNFAIKLSKAGVPVCVFDMDIVNPYYRTLDAKVMLDNNGVSLVVSDFANSNVDIPSLKGATYAMTADKSKFAVVDIGGDDRGALVLGRYKKEILTENNYNFVFVLNKFRPETSTVEQTFDVFCEIEKASGIKFTQIASNGNLGIETTISDIIKGLEFSKLFAKKVNLPISMVGISDRITEKVEIENTITIKLIDYLHF